MIDTIKKWLGIAPGPDYKQLVQDGALVLDVRTPGEYSGGHIKNSVNISVDALSHKLNKINKNQVVITCCASGMRSNVAASMLRSKGFTVYNGGSWYSLQSKIN